MHGMSLASEVIREAEKNGKVKAVTLEVGELAKITGEELAECIKGLVGWKVEVVGKEGKVSCPCGFKGKPRIVERAHDFLVLACPSCGGVPDVTEGGDIILLNVEVE